MERNQQNELEKKVAFKGKTPILCENQECQVYGNYYKCYFADYQKCEIYLNWIVHQGHQK